MIYIAYDQHYKEINAGEFPGLCKILEGKNLLFDTENKKGDLTNVRMLSKKFHGVNLVLTELFLSPLHYATIVHEINAGDNPVLFYKPLNCMIQLKRETTILN